MKHKSIRQDNSFKLFVSVIFFLLSFYSAFSQTPKLEFGPKVTIPDKEEFRFGAMIGTDETSMYMLKHDKRTNGREVTTYLNSVNYENGAYLLTKYAETRGDIDYRLEYSTMLNGQITMLLSAQDTKKNTVNLYAETINKKTLLPNNDIRKIDETPYTGTSRYYTFMKMPYFIIKVSPDSSKMLLLHFDPNEMHTIENYEYVVLDNSLNLLYKRKFKCGNDSKLEELIDFSIDNKGVAHFLFKTFKDKKKEIVDEKPNYAYCIISADKNEGPVAKTKININGKIVPKLSLMVDKKGNLVCGGAVIDNEFDYFSGVFISVIDPITKTTIVEKANPISQSIFANDPAEKRKTKDEIYRNYQLNSVLSDKGYYFVFEQNQFVQGNVPLLARNNILVVNMSETGELNYKLKIHKEQLELNDFYEYRLAKSTSFFPTLNEGKLFLFYNEEPIKKQTAQLVALSIDSTGASSKTVLSTPRKDYYECFVKGHLVRRGDKIITFFTSYKYSDIAKIHFE